MCNRWNCGVVVDHPGVPFTSLRREGSGTTLLKHLLQAFWRGIGRVGGAHRGGGPWGRDEGVHVGGGLAHCTCITQPKQAWSTAGHRREYRLHTVEATVFAKGSAAWVLVSINDTFSQILHQLFFYRLRLCTRLCQIDMK